MNKIFKIIISLLLSFMFFTYAFSNENFFGDAVKKYQSEKYDEARFLFERNMKKNYEKLFKAMKNYITINSERMKIDFDLFSSRNFSPSALTSANFSSAIFSASSRCCFLFSC